MFHQTAMDTGAVWGAAESSNEGHGEAAGELWAAEPKPTDGMYDPAKVPGYTWQRRWFKQDKTTSTVNYNECIYIFQQAGVWQYGDYQQKIMCSASLELLACSRTNADTQKSSCQSMQPSRFQAAECAWGYSQRWRMIARTPVGGVPRWMNFSAGWLLFERSWAYWGASQSLRRR